LQGLLGVFIIRRLPEQGLALAATCLHVCHRFSRIETTSSSPSNQPGPSPAMLEKLRDASKGWFAAVLILVLVSSFGVWGVSDMLNLTEQPKVATVGGEDITPDQFQQEFTRFLAQMSRSTGTEMTGQQAKAEGLDRVALERFVNKLSILKLADDLDLVISPSQIVEALKPIPGMVDNNGKLNPGAISQIARVNNINESQFIDLISGDLIREQMLRSVAGGIGMPPGLERALNMYRLERRVAEYLIIDPSRVGEIKDPDDGSLKAYFEENAAARYSTPESRSIVLITVSPEDVGKTINVPDADIAKLYEANRKRYEIPEKRVLEQIRFKSEAAATAAKAKLDAGEKFESVAKAEGFSPEDINLGEVAKGDKSVPAAVFDVPLMQPTAPSKNSFGGWVIVRATSSTPGSVKTLDDVREEIRKAVVDTKARDEIFEIGNKIEDALGGGATLEETASQLKLSLKTMVITRDGNDLAGNPVPGLPGGEFLSQGFAADTGADPELLQTPEGVYYAFRVDKITETAKKDFGAIKAQVLSDWRDAEMSRQLDKVAADILKRAKGGEALSKIATSLSLSVVSSDPFPRYGKTATFGEATVLAASDAKKGGVFSGPVALGKGVIVGRVTDIQFQDEPQDSPMRSAYLQRLVQSYVSDFVEQFETGVRQKVGASIDEERFKAFHNNE